MPLDRIDAAICRALQKDARQSNKDLAEAVGLAPSSCLERVRKLRERGVIRGFHVELDPLALGVNLQGIVTIRMVKHGGASVDAFVGAMLERSEVVAIHHLAGINDFVMHVAVRDAAHLRELSVDVICSRPEVGDVETALVFERYRGGGLPIYDVEEASTAE